MQKALGLNTGESHGKLKCVLRPGCQTGPRRTIRAHALPYTWGQLLHRLLWPRWLVSSHPQPPPWVSTSRERCLRACLMRTPSAKEEQQLVRTTQSGTKPRCGRFKANTLHCGPHLAPAHQAHSACSPHSNLGSGAPRGMSLDRGLRRPVCQGWCPLGTCQGSALMGRQRRTWPRLRPAEAPQDGHAERRNFSELQAPGRCRSLQQAPCAGTKGSHWASPALLPPSGQQGAPHSTQVGAMAH